VQTSLASYIVYLHSAPFNDFEPTRRYRLRNHRHIWLRYITHAYLTSTSVFYDEQLVLDSEIMKQCRLERWGDAERYSLNVVPGRVSCLTHQIATLLSSTTVIGAPVSHTRSTE